MMATTLAPSTTSRVFRSLPAGLVLAALLIGPPLLLIAYSGAPWEWDPDWARVRIAFHWPPSQSALQYGTTIIGWLAWALLATAIIRDTIVAITNPDAPARKLDPIRILTAALIGGLTATAPAWSAGAEPAANVVVTAPVDSAADTTAPNLTDPPPPVRQATTGTTTGGQSANAATTTSIAGPNAIASARTASAGTTAITAETIEACETPPDADSESHEPEDQDEAPGDGVERNADGNIVHPVIRGNRLWDLAAQYYDDPSVTRRSSRPTKASSNPTDAPWSMRTRSIQAGASSSPAPPLCPSQRAHRALTRTRPTLHPANRPPTQPTPSPNRTILAMTDPSPLLTAARHLSSRKAIRRHRRTRAPRALRYRPSHTLTGWRGDWRRQ
ncbi:hypothetical protein GCM10029992_36080 [Glycomyces albus]